MKWGVWTPAVHAPPHRPGHLLPGGRPQRLQQGQQRGLSGGPGCPAEALLGWGRPGAPLMLERPGALLTVSKSSSQGGDFSPHGRAGPPPAWGGQSGGRTVSQGKPQPPAALCRPPDLRLGLSAHLSMNW